MPFVYLEDMWHLGAQFSGGFGSAGLKTEIKELIKETPKPNNIFSIIFYLFGGCRKPHHGSTLQVLFKQRSKQALQT